MAKKDKKEKVYISRDKGGHGDDTVWVWRKPKKGNFKPVKMELDCDWIVWQRPDSMDELETSNCYTRADFKKKFGISINKGTCKSAKISKKLLDSDKYKMFDEVKDKKKAG